jgi:hypothetical protein
MSLFIIRIYRLFTVLVLSLGYVVFSSLLGLRMFWMLAVASVYELYVSDVRFFYSNCLRYLN